MSDSATRNYMSHNCNYELMLIKFSEIIFLFENVLPPPLQTIRLGVQRSVFTVVLV